MKLRFEVQWPYPTKILILRVQVKAFADEIRLMALIGEVTMLPGASATTWINVGKSYPYGDRGALYLIGDSVLRKLGIASDVELINTIGMLYKSMVPDGLPSWSTIIPNANAEIKAETQSKPLPSGWTSDT
jgi:hypothetical protein